MRDLSPRLLVVGHDPDRGALAGAIADSEFDPEVVAVADRQAAEATLRERRVDCVVTGYEVPDERGRTFMGGLRLLETVREDHGDLPVVIFTDVVNEDSLRRAAANGVRAYVRDQPGQNVQAQLRYHVDSAMRGQLAERRAAEQDRINELMRGVTQTLVLEEERGEMLEALCAELTHQAVYRYAAYHDRTEGVVEASPAAAAGTAEGESDATGLLDRSVERGTVETASIRRAIEDGEEGEWETVLRIAVPIGYEEERFGVLVVETDPEHTFFEAETAVLAELGEAIGHALNAVETREALRTREAELEHRTEQLEGFASLVSHDVRNPLNVAQGYLDLLAERVDDPAIGEIETSLSRIETIVGDILALTRAEQELETAPTDLDGVVADAWGSVDTPGATLHVGEDLPSVEADESQLQRVFENLFRNSIEHGLEEEQAPAAEESAGAADESPGSEGDAPALAVRVQYDDGTLVVEDDGLGFGDGAPEDLFELGTTGEDGGTGIGLAIVGDLIDAHGWSVTAEEGDDGGARFRIEGVEPLV